MMARFLILSLLLVQAACAASNQLYAVSYSTNSGTPVLTLPTNSLTIPTNIVIRIGTNKVATLADVGAAGTDTNATALALAAYAAASNAQTSADGAGVVGSNALPLGGGTMSTGAKIGWGSQAEVKFSPLTAYFKTLGNVQSFLFQGAYTNSIYGTGVWHAIRQQADSNYFSIVQSTIDGGPAGLTAFDGVRLTWNNLGASNYTFWIREGRVDLGTNVTIYGDGSGLSGVVAAGSLSIGAYQADITNYVRVVVTNAPAVGVTNILRTMGDGTAWWGAP